MTAPTGRRKTVWLPSRVVDGVEAVRRIGVYSMSLRVVVIAGAAVCWLASGLLGGFDVSATLLVVLLAVMAAVSPDGPAPLLLIAGMVGVWVNAVEPVSFTWAFVPALCALVVHVAAARAATTADGAVHQLPATLLWLRQLAVVVTVTLSMWLLVLWLSNARNSGTVAAGVIAFAASAAVAIAFTRWSLAPLGVQDAADEADSTGGSSASPRNGSR